MGPLDAFEAIIVTGAPTAADTGTDGGASSARHAERVLEMRRIFEKRTGSFGPEDAWFEARSRAFWDDAVTKQGFARHVMGELAHDVREWVGPLSHAHRGLFDASRAESTTAGGAAFMLRDLWGGAEFIVEHVEAGMRHALDAATGPLDGRVVARASAGSHAVDVAILPGAIFHPEEARAPLLKVLEAARARELATDDVLDALLRMEKSLRALSRVKASYAYRETAL